MKLKTTECRKRLGMIKELDRFFGLYQLPD